MWIFLDMVFGVRYIWRWDRVLRRETDICREVASLTRARGCSIARRKSIRKRGNPPFPGKLTARRLDAVWKAKDEWDRTKRARANN